MEWGWKQIFVGMGGDEMGVLRGWKGKGKEVYLYSAIYQASQSGQTWITQLYLQITPCLPFLRKRSPDVAAPTEVADI